LKHQETSDHSVCPPVYLEHLNIPSQTWDTVRQDGCTSTHKTQSLDLPGEGSNSNLNNIKYLLRMATNYKTLKD